MTGTNTVQGLSSRFLGVLLDLDNTLYDFASAKEKACTEVTRFIGEGDPDDLISAFLFSPHGVENPVVIHLWLRDKGITDETVISGAIEIYLETKASAIIAYPGVIETLRKIHSSGLKIGAVTNASYEHANNRLVHIGIQNFMSCLVTPDTSGLKKPDPEMFIYSAEHLKVQPHQVCAVGDNLINDIRPAKQAGMCTVHAAYGNRLPPEYSEGIVADFTIQSFPELLPVLGI